MKKKAKDINELNLNSNENMGFSCYCVQRDGNSAWIDTMAANEEDVITLKKRKRNKNKN